MNAFELFDKLTMVLDQISPDKEPEYYCTITSCIDWDTNSVFDEPMEIATRLVRINERGVMPELIAQLVVDIYEEEIAQGNHIAACDMATLYYTGHHGEQNFAKAVEYYKLAADAGNEMAQECLGYCYYYGRDVEVDYAKAYNYFSMGAFKGYIKSLYKIGDMYRYGYHVPKNEAQAYQIYDRCLNTMTDEDARITGGDVMIRMADCTFGGIGTEQDLKKALRFYHLAESMFYDRLEEGDPFVKDGYKKAVEMQTAVRQVMQKRLNIKV